MVETRGSDGDKGRSLLSLARALQEERAKQAAADAEAQGKAAEERDRLATESAARAERERLRHEHIAPASEIVVAKEKPVESPANGPAGTKAETDETDQLWRRGRIFGRKPPSKPAERKTEPVRIPERAEATASRKDTRPVAEREADDARWKPLVDPYLVVGGIGRSKGLIATTTLAGALLGIMVALSMPKKYEAVAELLVDPRDLKIVEREITASGLPSEATLAVVENQARILTSAPVLTKTVEKLNLANDPEFNGTAAGLGSINPLTFLRSLFSGSEGGNGGKRQSLAVISLAEKVNVVRSGKTFILNVDVATQSPDKSALIANTLVDTFMQTSGELQSETAGRATNELTSRLQELKRSVEQAEDKVETYKSENDIFDPQGRSIADDEMVKLNDQLAIARAKTLELNAKAASARSLDVNSVVGGAIPEQAGSSVLTELRAQYAALKQEADKAAVRLGPRHPERQAAEAQLAGAREQIRAELRRIVSSVQVELKRAVELEQDLAARLAQLKVRRAGASKDMVELRELERDATAKRAVYEAFLLRARETGEQRDINTANITVISRAMPPLEASGPSRAAIAGAGTLLGLLAGLGLGAMRGAMDSLRSAERVRRPVPVRIDQDPVMAKASSSPPRHEPGEEAQPNIQSGASPLESGNRTPEPRGMDHSAMPRPQGPLMRTEPWPAHDELVRPAAPQPGYRPDSRPHEASASDDRYESFDRSIEELRAAVRECRDALRELASRRDRRYF